MDHSIAYLMEFNTMPFEIQIIECNRGRKKKVIHIEKKQK
jgi:hypothetical protein